MPDGTTQHVVHTHIDNGPKVTLGIEKNSRGFNYTVSVSNCSNVDEAISLLIQSRNKLENLINAGEPVISFNQKEQ